MIQRETPEGWVDVFPVGYKPISTMYQVANKWRTDTRVINRAGKILFTTKESKE